MESVKYLLNFLFKLSIVAFFAALVWWGVVTYNPNFQLRSLIGITSTASSTESSTSGKVKEGWLPSPRVFGGLLNKPATPGSENVATYGRVFNGYGTNSGDEFNYVTYKAAGVEMAQGKGRTPTNNGAQLGMLATTTVLPPNTYQYSQKNLYVRNLSMYEGGHVYTGLTFVGEARETMFINGKFPIIVADQTTGKAVSVSFAEATTNWTVPGWVRFQVKISTVSPSKVPCLMVFEQARMQGSVSQPARVVVPVVCN
jgi:hypothetical protein